MKSNEAPERIWLRPCHPYNISTKDGNALQQDRLWFPNMRSVEFLALIVLKLDR